MDAATWARAKDLLADVALRDDIEELLMSSDEGNVPDALALTGVGGGDVHTQLEPGTCVGPYVIIEQLGVGGMGAVFLGSDTRLHRKVALKCLTGRGTLPELRAKILHEARAAARISHPNVAVVHDVIEHDGRAFIVMEYVEGESLAGRLRRERLPIDTAVAIGRQLAAALAAAHARGVVHRDLKPANVQVMSDGTVKVLDFGVAQAVSALSSVSQETTIEAPIASCRQPGTPAYMAPEQLLGDVADERSDIYSLGIVLYEMVAGRRPYAATDARGLLSAFVEPAPAPHTVNAAVPSALSDVVARAIARDAHVRFQSAAELGAALTVAHKTASTTAVELMRPLAGRWVVAIVAALAILAAIGVPLVMRNRGPVTPLKPPVVAVMPFEAGADGSGGAETTGIAEVLTASIASVPGVVVVPRDSAAKYTTKAGGLPVAARELGLEYAITGAVQGEGDTRRVVLSVIDAVRGSIVASRAFESADGTTFPLLEQAGEWVIDQTEKLARSTAPRRPPLPMTNAQAFEDYSQARQYLDRRDVAGNVQLAIAALQRAIGRDPKFALAHAALGDAYWADYQTTRDRAAAEKAKDATLEALRLDPNQPMARYALALIYQGTGRRQDAVDELQKAIVMQPSSDQLHRLLGTIYSDLGNVDKAVSESLIAIRLRPGFWENYRSLGVIYLTTGRYRDAIATLTRLTELQPDSALGFQILGTAYHASGDLDRALTNYQRAIAIKPTPGAWSNIGTIHYRSGRFGDAASAYRMAIRLQPREPALYRNLGDALRRAGDAPGAAAAYRHAIDGCDQRLAVERNGEKLMALKALCLAKTGRMAQARDVIGAAMAIAPSAAVLYNLAIIETIDGRPQEALRALERAIEKGSSGTYASEDDEFSPLRALPEFRRIVSSR